VASIGHVLVGAAASKAYWSGQRARWLAVAASAAWSALSMLPDADVVGFALGVRYADPFGHRGATHSLTAALAGGIATGLAARAIKWPARRTAIAATAVLASHGLLDTLTDGGLGAALLWPFDLTRFFAPWRPIPVAPIGLDFLSPYGLFVSLTELVLFSPLLVWALRSRPIATPRLAAGIALWIAAVWMIGSTDPAREAVMSRLLREDTAYSSGYSEAAFRTLAEGQPEADVRGRLGPPREEGWFYFDGHAMEISGADPPAGCRVIRFENHISVKAMEPDACTARGVVAGLSPDEVAARLGPPPEACFDYSWSPTQAHFRQRTICVSLGKVAIVAAGWR